MINISIKLKLHLQIYKLVIQILSLNKLKLKKLLKTSKVATIIIAVPTDFVFVDKLTMKR